MPRLILALCVGLSGGLHPAHAENPPVTVYLPLRPPVVMDEPGRKGVAGDIALEALRRAGYHADLQPVPFARGLAMAAREKNALIVAITRLSSREHRYTWIAPVHRISRSFYTRDAAPTSFLAARTKYRQVGVERGTAQVDILLANGFERHQLVEVSNGESAPRMLLAQRIDAWYNWRDESRLLLAGLANAGAVHESVELGSTENFLACSRQCDPALVAALRTALAGMNADGTASRLRAAYFLDNDGQR